MQGLRRVQASSPRHRRPGGGARTRGATRL